MENYRYSHFDGFGNVKPGSEITQVTCDLGFESSHLYGFPLCSSTITQDFRTFAVYHNDYYLHPFTALIHPANASDYTGESFQSSFRPCNNQSALCNNDSKILYVNNPDTGELKSYQVLSQQQHQLPPNSDRPEPPVLRGFLPVAPVSPFTLNDMDNRTVYTLTDDVAFHPDMDMEAASTLTLSGFMLDTKSKKPCSCSKTQCLKLYCECFANGDYCNNCNCSNCYNNMYHEDERCRAIKSYLERNPEAFQPKIGKLKIGDVTPRHTKGCNCKRSECLKNYCECYEAKIMCSSMCKCIACKNYEESPDHRTLMNKQQYADTESILRTCASIEVVRAACACLLVRAEVAERERFSACLAEEMIIEEFGKCLQQKLQKDLDA